MSQQQGKGELYGALVKLRQAQRLIEEVKSLAWELQPRFGCGEPINDSISSLKTVIASMQFAHEETNR